MRKKAIEYICEKVRAGRKDIEVLKSEAAKKYALPTMIKNNEIRAALSKEELTPQIEKLLLKKPMRTKSGVTPIAVMIKPIGSCNWKCIYCPFTGRAAKSYTGEEPAALRARDNDFDSCLQVKSRIKQFISGGHPTDKCEVIVMGGTFLAMEPSYQYEFINGIYEGLNRKKAKNLETAKKINEIARHRMVGMTIETRPDVCTTAEIDRMLEFGATRVELGVQHPDDKVYALTKRGHTVKDVIDATQNLKDSAFKVLYHIMPGLPGSNPKKDIAMVKELFENPSYRPDMLKIYPTLVIGGTELYEKYAKGEFDAYDAEKAAKVIAKMYEHIPPYVRVMRIQRDIPATLVSGGVKKSNLREMVEKIIREDNIPLREIRAREIGFSHKKFLKEDFEMVERTYEASKGKELFISFENQDQTCIAGFVRLRIPGKSHRKEITQRTGLIRELHVYGQEVGIEDAGKAWQHKGFGKQLIERAEEIAKETFDCNKMVVISGVGVREYYKKRGYGLEGPYMAKLI